MMSSGTMYSWTTDNGTRIGCFFFPSIDFYFYISQFAACKNAIKENVSACCTHFDLLFHYIFSTFPFFMRNASTVPCPRFLHYTFISPMLGQMGAVCDVVIFFCFNGLCLLPFCCFFSFFFFNFPNNIAPLQAP